MFYSAFEDVIFAHLWKNFPNQDTEADKVLSPIKHFFLHLEKKSHTKHFIMYISSMYFSYICGHIFLK